MRRKAGRMDIEKHIVNEGCWKLIKKRMEVKKPGKTLKTDRHVDRQT